MARTTPPRPIDVEAHFPELAAYRGTTTRLHPRPGSPEASASSVGGPMLWPADEPWPVCRAAHDRGRGRRPADIHRSRRVLKASWDRDPANGPTDEDRVLLAELDQAHVVPGTSATDPLPLIGLAQLYRRDVPDLAAGPGDTDLLQVFWCPYAAHGPGGHDLELHLRWRRSWEVGDVLAPPPQPRVVGVACLVPEPCVLHPEQVVSYPFADLLPPELRTRIDAWEDRRVRDAGAAAGGHGPGPATYQYDLSIPPGWRVGGFASWHVTDPLPMDCGTCRTPMSLLLTVDSSEWDGGSGSWTPLEDHGLPTHRYAGPTGVSVGRSGELNVFACPDDPAHPHRWNIQ